MDKRFLYGGLLVVAGVGLVRALTSHRTRIKPGQTRMLLLGDSLAVGLTAPLKAAAAQSGVAFTALAKTGTRMDQWSSSGDLPKTLGEFKPTLVLVSLGTNDAYLMPATALGIATPALSTLLSKLKASGAELVWIGPPTLPAAKSPQVIELIRQSIPKKDYFPSDTLVIPRGSDNLHPTLKGYAGWAELIWKWLT